MRPPKVKAPRQAAGGYRWEAVAASVGITEHQGKKNSLRLIAEAGMPDAWKEMMPVHF